MPFNNSAIVIIWKEWIKFVIDKTGSARKLSEEIENALKAYMKK